MQTVYPGYHQGQDRYNVMFTQCAEGPEGLSLSVACLCLEARFEWD